MIFDKIVLLTIFLYITLNLRKVENFIDGGYKFEAFTAKSPTLQTSQGAIKGRVVYTIIKSTAMLFVLHFLVERHDKIGKPGTTPDGVVTADTWDGQQITQGQTFNGVVVSTLNDTTYHEEQTKSLGVWGWIYGTKVEDWRPSAPTTSINPFTENQPLKGWFRDQLAPIISLLWTGALLTMLGIAGTEDLNSDLWQTLLWMETLTNEVVNVI